ncbi:hypothetical protein BBJ28_00005823 [Nothophytophthora sp. Chile5]|nr:hypothetical protein BBJ28_00005823 [Nothophytophthora sp. Chile5]
MELLRALSAEARAVRSLYGPTKLRKQVTADETGLTTFSSDAYAVASALQSQNAATAILQQALDDQRRKFGTRSLATALAVKAACIIGPSRFKDDGESSIDDLVAAHVVLGGVTSTASSRVLSGLLLPITDSTVRSALRRRFRSISDGTVSIDGGVALIAGDLLLPDTAASRGSPRAQIAFVYGEISAQALDVSASAEDALLCIPVSSFDTLRQVAVLSGAEIVESWKELLPSAIGREKLQLRALALSVSDAVDDEEDEKATLFLQVSQTDVPHQLHASVIVQGPSRSLAVELRNETRKALCRLRNALRSGCLVPGNGGFWCACAAAVELEAQAQETAAPELVSFALSRLVDSLNTLGVILLENTDENASTDDAVDVSFFSRLAKTRSIQQRFARGVNDVGALKFYSKYYDFRGADYAVLKSSSKGPEPEDEDGRAFHTDECLSLRSAIRKAFRVLQLLLSVDSYQIN